MEEKKVLEEFSLDGLRLGMTVYHPNAGDGKVPVVLNGVRLYGDPASVEVRLLYSHGGSQWTKIEGMSTIPCYKNNLAFHKYASDVNEMLDLDHAVSSVVTRNLTKIVIDLTKHVLDAKCY